MTTNKAKILMIGDHALSTSGVGVQSRYLITGLVATGKYSFRCLGAAVRHQDYNTVTVNPDFVIKPIDGFGDQNMIRQLLVSERPDALFLFTDPRFFMHIFSMEEEIHQFCPIIYAHLWDECTYPPTFNKPLYASCDLINCINYPTYEMVKTWFPGQTNYVPHGVPADLFRVLPTSETQQFKRNLLGSERADHFIVLFVSRNARRKVPSDVILSFKMFLDELEKKHGHRKASLLMHCDHADPEGPNLIAVIEALDVKNNVVFSKDRIGFHEMNALYNVADCVVNLSINEGFGLSVLESKMAGRPVIANCTGGLTRQVLDHETGEEYGVAIRPAARALVGNQQIPFIFEDFTKHEDVRDALLKLHEMGQEKRRELGLRAREHCLKHYNLDDVIKDWDKTLSDTLAKWKDKELPNNKRWHHVEV